MWTSLQAKETFPRLFSKTPSRLTEWTLSPSLKVFFCGTAGCLESSPFSADTKCCGKTDIAIRRTTDNNGRTFARTNPCPSSTTKHLTPAVRCTRAVRMQPRKPRFGSFCGKNSGSLQKSGRVALPSHAGNPGVPRKQHSSSPSSYAGAITSVR